jgi:beta-galactosidase
VLGPRTGYADQEARARPERAPARLTEAAGVWYDAFSNLTEDVRVTGGPLDLPPSAAGTRWVDALTVDGADIPATVTVHTGRSPDGRKLHFVHNWSWDRASVIAPADLADAVSGDHLAGGEALTLGPWDVRVLVSRHAHAPATPPAGRLDR